MPEAISVFLVDDHTLVRQALRRLVEAAAMEVVGETNSGDEAIGEIRRLRPRVALLDLSLPGASGFEVTRHVAAMKQGTQVLILSMFADADHLRRALEAGAAGYVLKDNSADDLIRAIRCVDSGQAFFSPRVAAFLTAGHRQPGARAHDCASHLSPREREILRLIALGKTGKEIATVLNIAPGTVETHRRRLMSKLGLAKVAELTLYAVRQGIVTAERA